jgi:hypothetical protein
MRRVVRHTAVLLLVLCTTLLPTGAADQVPFHAAIDTDIVVAPSAPCFPPTCIRLEIGGQGNAAHMGRISIDGPSAVMPDATGTGGLQNGQSTLTAANGDTIEIRFEGTFSSPMGPLGPVEFEGSWRVTGGTGRFDNATGGGTYSGSGAIPTGILLLDGTISRRGAR